MKVLITGSASTFAGALLPLLAADERVTQVIGVDRRETSFNDARFTQVLLDARSPQIGRVLIGMDAVVHLTTASTGIAAAAPGAQRQADNIESGQNVFRCAAHEKVPCVVHVSTAMVYELPARERPINEQHPRAALPGLKWAEEQVVLEEWLDAFETEHDELRVVRLRPHLLVGKHGSPWVRRLLRSMFSVRLAGHPPRLQCVHAQDVARAIQRALFADVRGAFNLACGNSATLLEMQRLNGRGLVPLPFPLFARLRTGPTAIDPSWFETLRHEIILDTSRARRRLGWKPQYDSVQACLQAAD